MKPLVALALFCLCLTIVAAEKPAVVPKIKLGKDTTYLLEPLEADGYINYERAINDLAKGKTTPETNAVVLHWELLGAEHYSLKNLSDDYFKELGILRPTAKTLKRKRFVTADWFFTARRVEGNLDKPTLTDDETAQLETISKQPWSAKQYPVAAEWLIENREAFDTLEEASRRVGYFAPLISRTEDGKRGLMIGANLPTIQSIRDMSKALLIRAMLRLHDGQPSDAYADGLTMRRLAQQIARGETLIDYLVGVAIETTACDADQVFLAHTTPSEPKFVAYRKAVAALPQFPTFVGKVDRHNRFEMLEALQYLRQQGTAGMKKIGGDGPGDDAKLDPAAIAALERLAWEPAFELANQWMDRAVVSLKLPTHSQRRFAIDACEDDLKLMKNSILRDRPFDRLNPESLPKSFPRNVGKVVIGLIFPACAKVEDARTRMEQYQSNVELAIALAHYHAATKSYPKTLAALVPKYLDKVPEDLFNQKPINYERTVGGYRFYSVGVNGRDDEGRGRYDTLPGDDLLVEVPMSVGK